MALRIGDDLVLMETTAGAPPTPPVGRQTLYAVSGGLRTKRSDGTDAQVYPPVLGTAPNVQTFNFTTAGAIQTWTKPANALWVEINLISGGAGGSGGNTASGCGGGGGIQVIKHVLASALGTTEQVVVGGGGAGSAGTTSGSGGDTYFGTTTRVAYATGGTGSPEGRTGAATGGKGGHGTLGDGADNRGVNSSNYGIQSGSLYPPFIGPGGTGGSGVLSTSLAGSGWTCSADSYIRYTSTAAAAAAGNGSPTGSSDVVAGHPLIGCSGVGGSSIASTTVAGGRGGNGGRYGGGGGGGGACQSQTLFSTGGNGGAGIAIITTFFS